MHAIAISPESLLFIIIAGAVAGTTAVLSAQRGVAIPVVVLELLAGIVLGPHVLGLKLTGLVILFKDLGLGLLFFFAGYETDVRRIAGAPLRLGVIGWFLSLAIGFAVAAALRAAGMSLPILYVGSAITTTAIGTLLPILSDHGVLQSRLGTYLMAAGAVGEFGPILVLTLVLSTRSSAHNGLILGAFVLVALAVAWFALGSSRRSHPLLENTLHSSSQLAVRWALVLVFGLALLAYRLGLDLLLGGFASGLIAGELLRRRPLPEFESKLTAVGFGFFVPFFFVVSGMGLDISAFGTVSGILRTLMFLALMLLARGVPAMVLYRRELEARERRALVLLSSTQLPLVLAITELALANGRMRPGIAAALVGAAVLSTLIFPLAGLRVVGEAQPAEPVTPTDPVATETGTVI